MPRPTPKAVTELLREWGEGEDAAYAELIPLVYDELHRMAAGRMRGERPGHTLQPTALVHEAYLRLAGQRQARWQSRTHFLAVAARMMRRVLVDHARRRRAGKRHSATLVTFVEEAVAAPAETADVLALDAALEGLAEVDRRKSRVVELRVFGGLTIAETAEALGVSIGTVIGDYRLARAWLRRELEKDGD